MRIALITEPEKEFGAGVGRYSRSLVSELLHLRSSYHFLLVSDDHIKMQVAPGTTTELSEALVSERSERSLRSKQPASAGRQRNRRGYAGVGKCEKSPGSQ